MLSLEGEILQTEKHYIRPVERIAIAEQLTSVDTHSMSDIILKT